MPLGRHLLSLAAEGCRHVHGGCFLRANPRRRKTRRSLVTGAVAIWPMHFISNRAIQVANDQADHQIQYSPRHTAGSFFRRRGMDVQNRASWELLTHLGPFYRGSGEIHLCPMRSPSGISQFHGPASKDSVLSPLCLALFLDSHALCLPSITIPDSRPRSLHHLQTFRRVYFVSLKPDSHTGKEISF